ncbi:MAG: ATP phosphoribosyltransferase regulatory subunit [Coriobacteriia bacterium]
MRPVTPRGFRDVLPQEAEERDGMTRAMTAAMAAWGYGRVETPTLEEYRTLEAGAGASLETTAFRLFDGDGRLLAMRPEMTVPIARMIATRYENASGPHRFSYISRVYREQDSMRGQSREFTQVGLELVGVEGPRADAEVVAVLADSLRTTGLEGFVIGIGVAGVLRALIRAAGMPDDWGREVMSAAHDRDLVGIDRLASVQGVAPDAAAALREVPGIRGGREAISRCRQATAGCDVSVALDALEEMWALLEASGVAECVSVDFGIMRSFDYYTGMVLEVYAPGLGLPIGGGGRYDDVLARYGAPAPAAGFAIGLERLHIALAEQGRAIAGTRLDAVLGGPATGAFAAARVLREAGWSVVLEGDDRLQTLRTAERLGAFEALYVGDSGIVRLDSSGELSVPLGDPLPAAPSALSKGVGA